MYHKYVENLKFRCKSEKTKIKTFTLFLEHLHFRHINMYQTKQFKRPHIFYDN